MHVSQREDLKLKILGMKRRTELSAGIYRGRRTENGDVDAGEPSRSEEEAERRGGAVRDHHQVHARRGQRRGGGASLWDARGRRGGDELAQPSREAPCKAPRKASRQSPGARGAAAAVGDPRRPSVGGWRGGAWAGATVAGGDRSRLNVDTPLLRDCTRLFPMGPHKVLRWFCIFLKQEAESQPVVL